MTLLAICLRVFGLTIIDLSIDTDGAEVSAEVNGELSGRSVGFEYRPDVLPSVEDE